MMTDREGLTRNQTLVLEKLGEADGPLSAYELLDRLRGDGFRAPLQVYRALDRLTRAGLAHRLESLNAFVACCGGHDHGHAGAMTAFAICEKCGQVAELSDEAIGARVQQWVGRSGFRASRAVMEFRGLCERCAAS
jgi:Fur family transcriptional regulator, zinc uptake regulator